MIGQHYQPSNQVLTYCIFAQLDHAETMVKRLQVVTGPPERRGWGKVKAGRGTVKVENLKKP